MIARAALSLLLAIAPSAGHVLVYSKGAGGVLLLAGETEGDPRIRIFTGSGWRDLGALGTAPRSLPACAYDADRKLLLIHGGAIPTRNADGPIDWKVDGRTLAWDGRSWRTVSETGPSPRDHHAMVYDSARKRVVLFGGGDADPSGRSEFFGDTWEWDGTTWTRVATTGPPPKVHHAMAYDPLRKRTVLAGGYGPAGPDGKTWEWDGTTWSDRGESPVALRGSPRVAFDGNRNKVVLFGGETSSGLASDTYEWDGSRWNRIAEQGPPGRTVHALAFDEKRRVLVLFGGSGAGTLGDTWVFASGAWRRVGTR